MALIIKPGETTARKKRVHFAIYDVNGLITDDEGVAVTGGSGWAVATFAPVAGDLKVGYDNVASANATGTFAYRKNGEWYYEFADAEVAAGLLGGGADADTVYIEFKKNTYRSFVIRIPLRYDVESIKDNTITAGAIADNAIDAGAIAADAITAAKIADGAIDAATFAPGAINAAAIADGAIDAGAIAADAITAAKIADGAIDTATFVDGAITAAKIADNAITAAKIATDAIDADALKADAVTEIQGSIPGLQMRRSMTDQCVYSAKKVLTSARTRVFASEVALATAVAGHANDADGEVERWRWTAVDPGTGLASSWKLVQEL